MTDTNDDEDYCPICYGIIDDFNFVSFTNCSHKFCFYCATEISLKADLHCPIDFIPCTNVAVQLPDIVHRFETARKYQFYALSDWENVNNFMKDNWRKYLSMCCKVLLSLTTIKNQALDLLKTWSKQDSNINFHGLQAYQAQFDQINSNIDLFFVEILENINKSKFILETLTEFHPNDLTLHHLKLREDNKIIVNLQAIFSNNVTEAAILKFGDMEHVGKSQQTFMIKEITKNLNNDICSLKAISKHLTRLMICELNDNHELYVNHRPEISGQKENQCLICAKLIRVSSYAKFSQCNHKICLSCLKKHCLTKGSCPFEEDEIEDLVIVDGKNSSNSNCQTSGEYLTVRKEAIFSNRIKTTMNTIRILLWEILNLKYYLPTVIDLTTQILKAPRSSQPIVFIKMLRSYVHYIHDTHYIKCHNMSQVQIHASKNWKGLITQTKSMKHQLLDQLHTVSDLCVKFLCTFGHLHAVLFDEFTDEEIDYAIRYLRELYTGLEDLLGYLVDLIKCPNIRKMKKQLPDLKQLMKLMILTKSKIEMKSDVST